MLSLFSRSSLLPCRLFATCSLAVVHSLYLSSESLCGRLLLRGSSRASPTPLLSKVPKRDRRFAVEARAPRHCRLKQRVLLLSLVWETRRLPSLYRWFPTPLCDTLGCVHPLGEGLHRGLLSLRDRWVVRHRRLVVDPRLFLVCERIAPKWSTHLLPKLLLLCVRSVPFPVFFSLSIVHASSATASTRLQKPAEAW